MRLFSKRNSDAVINPIPPPPAKGPNTIQGLPEKKVDLSELPDAQFKSILEEFLVFLYSCLSTKVNMNFPPAKAEEFRKKPKQVQIASGVALWYTQSQAHKPKQSEQPQAFAFELHKNIEKLETLSILLRTKEISWINGFVSTDGLKHLLYILHVYCTRVEYGKEYGFLIV